MKFMKIHDVELIKHDDDLFELIRYHDDPGWLLDREAMVDLAAQIKELGF